MKRILVSGDRNWDADAVARRVLGSLLARHGPAFTVVHGAAPGVDSAFDRVANEFGIPVKYIGVGEQIGDLQVFDRARFVEAIFG